MNRIILLVIGIALSSIINAQDFSELYKNMSPSVVTVMVKEQHIEADRNSMQKKMISSQGIGSGVLVSEDGDIWTAAHVVQTAQEVMVSFQSGEVVPAKVITTNAATDVALIRLMWMPKKFAIANIANSDRVNVGDHIFIIGAPYGLQYSLSVGYISGRIKETGESADFARSEYFQTDASINHGNSGGPMFNEKGEVIGLVSSILSQSGGFDGIGFVVTSNIATAHLVGDQPFWYGAKFIIISGELRNIFNVAQEMGLLVQKVAAGSPAALSGLQPGIFKTSIEGTPIWVGGDIILKVGEFEIAPDTDFDKVGTYLSSLKPNDTFKVTVLRAGEKIELIGVVPNK
jgi:S1-C subfamily serine protease